MEKLNIVVLSDDIDLRIHIKNHLLSEDIVICGYSDFDSAGKLKVESLFPDMVICAVRGAVEERIFNFVQVMLTNVRNCVVVLVNDNIDVDLVNKAAKFGIKTVLPFDLPPEAFESNLMNVVELEHQRMLDTNEGKKIRSKVIAFFGGKGGTGKTTVSVNVASSLAKEGKRVILIDLDLQFGDITMALDLEPKDTIVELVQDRGGITIENINAFAVVHASGMSVLGAPKSPETAEFVKPEHVEKIIDVLRPYFEYIVIDMPAVFNDVSMMACENCDEIYLVYNMDIFSLRNAKSCMSILEQLHQRDKTKLIINKDLKGLIKVKDFENVLGIPAFSVIDTDFKLAVASANKGTPILISQPKSELARSFRDIAGRIIQLHSGVATLPDVETKKGLFKKRMKSEGTAIDKTAAAKDGAKDTKKGKKNKKEKSEVLEKLNK